ncbi:MAG: transketolase [Myxococcota bacterium]
MASELSQELRDRAENTIRFLAVDAVQRANSGHPGAPMGLARPAFLLWDKHLRFDPSDPAWPLRDRFVLSAGHASMLQYALLHLFGYDLTLDDIARFRQLGSKTPGHPEYGDTPGVELTTGPLGQGFAHGVGMALAGKLAASQLAGGDVRGPGHHIVYGIVSDGDLMEGIAYEAAALAGHLGLGNLVYLYDDNRITIDGPTSLCWSEDVAARFAAAGWHVQTADGQNVAALDAALEAAKAETERPSIIVMRTTIGYGSPAVAGKSKAHGAPLGPDEVVATKKNLGWPTEGELLVPDDVAAYGRARAAEKKAERAERDAAFRAWAGANPERAEAFEAARARRAPAGLADLLAEGMTGLDEATRNHGKLVLSKLAEHVPYLVGGSADLAGSAAPPVLSGRGVVGPGAGEGHDPFAGHNIHFGIREHAMGAVANGIALDGTFLPYSGTFLIFSDYMRPAIRLAALMGVRSIFVFTHDSIFVGEDGPTHQPIEQLDSLRAIPNLPVWRPADGVETAAAYAWILEQASGPALLSLSRQKVKALERAKGFALADVWKGGYAVVEPKGKPDVVLLATGTEVRLACDAAAKLAAGGLAVRVVSVPCLELFEAQGDAYVEGLVPDDGTPVVAVEAARGESFRRLVGRKGLVYGIDRFGASAPAPALAEHFGFTPDALAARVKELVG